VYSQEEAQFGYVHDTLDFVAMESNLDQNDIENVQFNLLIWTFVSERFNLPAPATQQILGQLWNWSPGI